MLAPASHKTNTPFSVGSKQATAGRSIPVNVLSFNTEAATAAPVCPAETAAGADPFFTRTTGRENEGSFFWRLALAAETLMSQPLALWYFLTGSSGNPTPFS